MHTLRRSGAISAAELSAALRDYVIIDVRPTVDWEGGHIPGSHNAQPDHLDDIAGQLDARLPAVIVTHDGANADRAAGSFKAHGRDAIILAGGHKAWMAAGGCVVQRT